MTEPFIESPGRYSTTDNNYSKTASLDFTTEQIVFEITDDTRYQLLNPWIDLTPFTVGDVVTIQMYRSVAAAGATYRKASAAVVFTVGTDNPIVELGDIAHYGYTKIVASSSPGRTVEVPFGYIKKALE